MTYEGARGQTASEMAKVPHFTLDGTQFHTAMGSLLHRTGDNSGAYELREGNAL